VLGVDRGTHVLAATSESELVRNAAVGEKRKAATARLQMVPLDPACVGQKGLPLPSS
jgi:hypothetical protein